MTLFHAKFFNQQTDRSTYQEFTNESFFTAENVADVAEFIKENEKDQWHNEYEYAKKMSENDNLELVTKSASVIINEVRSLQV